MKRALYGWLLAATLVVGVAAPDEPFKISKGELERKYKIIALAPPEADSYLQLSDAVKVMMEQEVAGRLEKRGYKVLPSGVLAAIRAQMTAQLDMPADAAKQAAVREHSFRELWFRHQINAIAIIRVRVFSVPTENDRIEWDGSSQKLATEGKSVQYKANVNVSSVVVGIYDSADAPLYVNYGGLEPLMRRIGDQLQPVPVDQLLRNEEKIRKAAQLAVKPI